MRIRVIDRLKAMLSVLFAWTIWHPDAIDPNEWKYRRLKRFWLPAFDLVMIGAGVWAAAYGSPILHRLFSEHVIDVMGLLLALVSAICLAGVAFPRLWKVEIFGKLTMVFLLISYAAAVAFFPLDGDPSRGFVVFILVSGLFLPAYRLDLLAEEIKERREG